MSPWQRWSGLWAAVWVVSVGCSGSGAPEMAAKLLPSEHTEAQNHSQDTNAPVADTFAYNAQNKRDPFRSYLVEVSERRSSEHAGRTREETEHLEISDYRLTGLMTGISQPKAMVEDPSGRGYVLHIGARLGKNGGRVTTIAPHGIQVTEDAVDPLGRHQRNTIDVPLPQSAVDAESSP